MKQGGTRHRVVQCIRTSRAESSEDPFVRIDSQPSLLLSPPSSSIPS